MMMSDNRRRKIIARQRKLKNLTQRLAKAAKRERNKKKA
jgi:hypothetical protein